MLAEAAAGRTATQCVCGRGSHFCTQPALMLWYLTANANDG